MILENFAASQGKIPVQCTSAGQFVGQRTSGELLLLKKATDKKSLRAASGTLQKLSEVMSLTSVYWHEIKFFCFYHQLAAFSFLVINLQNAMTQG